MNDTDVANYLTENPDFFQRHLELLDGLQIPHPTNGGAISLLERQVILLRKSAEEHKGQFERLVHVARDNEAIMQKSRRLVLAGLTCANLDDFAVIVDDAVRNDFDIPFHSLILFSDKALDANVRVTKLSDAEPVLKEVLLKNGCYCGVLSVAEAEYLFESHCDDIMSSAVLPLVSRCSGSDEYIGVLALGSRSLDKFSRENGTLFLEYLSELLSAILLRLMP